MESSKINVLVGALFISAFLSIQLAAQTGPGGSPISSIPPGALPPSTYQEGLVTTPNPIDRSGNLTVTGNIRGGQYFRDSVPYQDTTSFGQTLPSSSLDSFVRDSAGVEDIGSFTEQNKPYYSPTQTVTSVRPGSSVVIRPPATNFSGQAAQAPISETSTQYTDIVPDTGYIMPLTSPRPMSMTLEELEEQISSDIETHPETEGLSYRQYQILAEKFQKSMAQQISDKTPESRKSLTVDDSPLLPPIEEKLPQDSTKQKLPQQKEPFDEDEEGPESSGLRMPYKQNEDELTLVYEQREQQFDEPPKDYKQTEQQPDEQMQSHKPIKLQLDDLNERIDRVLAREIIKKKDENVIDYQSGINESTKGLTYKTPQYKPFQHDIYAPKVEEIDPSINVKAQKILGPYHTAATLSESNFNKNMVAAERYLKLGQYYRAVDAYTLALVYKPDDPIAYAGKSYALFASGEYMSSALFLSRIIERFPEYAKLKIDIETMTGSKENLQERVTEAEEWLGRSDAPELHFLLAYIYYQMNETGLAQKAIDAAYEKAPHTAAVVTLKKAIEGDI